MSHATTPAPPVLVDVRVILTAIVRPEPDAGGFSASIPALPGCHTQGETLDELNSNLREVVEMLLEEGEPKLDAHFIGTQTVTIG